MTKNASQGSINQQIFPLIPERLLSELPEPPRSSPRTTKLYDRRQDDISLDEVERIEL